MSLPADIPDAPKDERYHVVYDTSKDKETGAATGVPATAGNVVVGRPAEALPSNDVEVVAGHVEEPGKGSSAYNALTAPKRRCCRPWMLAVLGVVTVLAAGGAVAVVFTKSKDDGSDDSESVSEFDSRGSSATGAAATTETRTATVTTTSTTTRSGATGGAAVTRTTTTRTRPVTTTTLPPVTTTTTISKSLSLTIAVLANDADTFIEDATVLASLKTSLLADFTWDSEAADLEVTLSTAMPESRRLNLRGLSSAARRLSGLAYAAVKVDLSGLSDWETTASEAAVTFSEESYASELETAWNSALSAASSSQTVEVLSVVANSGSTETTGDDLCLQMFGTNQTSCALDSTCTWGLLTNSTSICVSRTNSEDSCSTAMNYRDPNRCLRQSGCTWISFAPRGRCITLDLYTTTTTRGPTTTRTRPSEALRGEFDICPLLWEDETACEGAPLCYWNGTACGRNTSLTRGMEPCNVSFNTSDACTASTSSLCYWNETSTDCNVNTTQAKAVAADFLDSHELCATFFEDEESCGNSRRRSGLGICVWNSTESSCSKNATGNATLYEERGLELVVRALVGDHIERSDSDSDRENNWNNWNNDNRHRR